MATTRPPAPSYTLPRTLPHARDAPQNSSSSSSNKTWRNRLGFRQQQQQQSAGAGAGAGAAGPDESSAGAAAAGTTREDENENENDLQRVHSTTTRSTRSHGRARWWRVRLFRGMVADVRRRAPYYWSDWADAWDYRVVPATVYMYFAK